MTSEATSRCTARGATGIIQSRRWREPARAGATNIARSPIIASQHGLPEGSASTRSPGTGTRLRGSANALVASVHSKLHMTKMQMTKRILKALSHPAVEILAHPTGRQRRKRTPIAVDLDTVFHAAKEYDVALELNAQPQRLNLSDVQVYRARELGVRLAIDTDARSVDQLRFMQYGIDQARRGWLEREHVLNALSWVQLQQWLKRRRS